MQSGSERLSIVTHSENWLESAREDMGIVIGTRRLRFIWWTPALNWNSKFEFGPKNFCCCNLSCDFYLFILASYCTPPEFWVVCWLIMY